MRSALISAAMLGVVHVTVPVATATPVAPAGRPASDGGRGATLARAGAEGGRGHGWRRRRGYREPYRHRAEPYAYGWAPPPRDYYAPPPPQPHDGWAPEPPPRYDTPPRSPSAGVWIDPGS